MADTKAGQTIVVESEAERTRREIAETNRQIRENPLDKAKVRGGVYVGADGVPHDAHGNPLKGRAKALALGKESDEDDEDAGESEDLDAMSVEELAALAEERGITVEGTGAGGRIKKADYIDALST